MRLLAAVLFACLAGSLAVAADKDEDLAKEAAVAFMKAVKAKDVDAVMKTVDVPFMVVVDRKPKVYEKVEDLKADLKTKLEALKDTDKFPTEASEVLDGAAIRKKVEGKKDEDLNKMLEKVLGDKGYAVVFKGRGAVFVRVKDGKAKVVGVPD